MFFIFFDEEDRSTLWTPNLTWTLLRCQQNRHRCQIAVIFSNLVVCPLKALISHYALARKIKSCLFSKVLWWAGGLYGRFTYTYIVNMMKKFRVFITGIIWRFSKIYMWNVQVWFCIYFSYKKEIVCIFCVELYGESFCSFVEKIPPALLGHLIITE